MRMEQGDLQKLKKILNFEIPRQTRSQSRRDKSTNENVLIYPSKKQLINSSNLRGSVTITENDLARLEPGKYMNDTLVDFYLK